MYYIQMVTTFRLVDYSARIPGARRKAEVGGKFVILSDGSHECLVMAPRKGFAFHANIVEAFLLEEGRAGRYNSKHDHYDTTGTGWSVLGGGHWRLIGPEALLTLEGTSLAYGSFPREGVRENMEKTGAFPGYRIEIS